MDIQANPQTRASLSLVGAYDNLFVDIPTRMTVKTFFAFTEHTERQYQLLNGRPRMNPAPLIKHQRIVGNLHILLEQFIKLRAFSII